MPPFGRLLPMTSRWLSDGSPKVLFSPDGSPTISRRLSEGFPKGFRRLFGGLFSLTMQNIGGIPSLFSLFSKWEGMPLSHLLTYCVHVSIFCLRKVPFSNPRGIQEERRLESIFNMNYNECTVPVWSTTILQGCVELFHQCHINIKFKSSYEDRDHFSI